MNTTFRYITRILSFIFSFMLFFTTFRINASDSIEKIKYQHMRDKVVQVAVSQVGTMEDNRDNRTKYNRWWYGNNTSAQWCAIFVAWCFNEAGMTNYPETLLNKPTEIPTFSNAYCPTIGAKYLSYNRWVPKSAGYNPRPGDLVLFDDGVRVGGEIGKELSHIGIVRDYDIYTNVLHTIEGNTNSKEANFGGAYGVCIKTYELSKYNNITGYCIPFYPGDEEFTYITGEGF